MVRILSLRMFLEKLFAITEQGQWLLILQSKSLIWIHRVRPLRDLGAPRYGERGRSAPADLDPRTCACQENECICIAIPLLNTMIICIRIKILSSWEIRIEMKDATENTQEIHLDILAPMILIIIKLTRNIRTVQHLMTINNAERLDILNL